MSRQIELRPLAELKGDPRNPKAHRQDLIEASVSRFGFVEPIVLDERTGLLISGHGRLSTLSAMAEDGEDPPEGVSVGEDGGWLVPVVVGWESVDDNEAAAALIAMNRTTELGGWVDDALLDLLDSLRESEVNLDGTGYRDADLRLLQDKLDTIGTFDVEEPTEDSEEIDVDGWEFTHRCPSCGFEYND